ncbi:MAG: twin-arginine translocase subunit TatC [Prevotellaceae bacterium]|jgi:sec-independent protein translocase protein TatC|nr:twin-arginine translocase subunit TatC [Prevotellaceae bacterium]
MADKELSFWGHLEELRRMLFRMILALAILMLLVFLNKSFIFDTIIFGPCSSDFILYRWLCSLGEFLSRYLPSINLCPEAFQIKLVNINLSSQFIIHITTAFWVALILGFPFLLWELWRFVAPALYPKEQRGIRTAFIASSFLFYCGVVMAYVLIFPLALQFFWTYYVSNAVENMFSLQSYVGLLTPLVLVMGLVFQLPIIVNLLSRLGLFDRSFLRKYRRHAIVILMALAAVITPTVDAVSMLLTAIPLYILYEVSILTCRKKREA